MPNFSLLVSLLGTVLFVSVVQGQDNRVSLQTPDGIIVGTRENTDRDRSPRVYYAFKGIEYARAERFQEPVLKELKGETIQATQSGSLCPQWGIAGQRPVGSEECLFINVYTPYIPATGGRGGIGVGGTVSRSQLPVMVYFHSGGYMMGSADQGGPRKLMKQDVILVTLNYRLGVLGYLSTGDSHIPGNFGLLDQITALKWVQKYIRHFGGDAGRVTIFGNSAGSASVHLLTLSPRAFGDFLFHSAILQSGNALCDWAVESNPSEYAHAIGEAVGCSGDSEELAICLKEKSVEELIDTQAKMAEIWIFPIRTAPVVDKWRGDDAVLPGNPEELMEAGAFAQVPVMAGVVTDEGLLSYSEIHLMAGTEKFRNTEYFEGELIPKILTSMLDDDTEIDVVTDAVKTQYFQGINVENETKLAISEMVELLGDIATYSCHWKFLEKLSAGSRSSVYSYLFTHKTPRSPSVMSKQIRSLREVGVHHALFDHGISHCDELFYLFEPFNILPGNLNEKLTPVDERVSDIMTKLWTAFASSGNPSSALQYIPGAVPWRPVRPGNINYYNITSIPAPMGQDYRKGEALFWLRTVPYIRSLGQNISELETYQTLFFIFLGLFILFLLIALVLGVIVWRKRSSQQTVNL